MRIHLFSTPNTQTTRAFYLDGFCLRTILFSRLLKRLGHEVILYGVEQTEAECDHFVQVITEAERKQLIGEVPYQAASFDFNMPLAQHFNARAANHLRSVKQPGDVLCTIAGTGQAQIAESHPECPLVEFSVGYTGVAPRAFRVYQSYAWQHVVYGFSGVQGGRHFDAVIPPWFLLDEFPYVEHPEPYVVYCGRFVHSKGMETVCHAAKLAGVTLICIGHGVKELVTYGEIVENIPDVERNKILANATACLMPTQYVEPFGNVSAEAQLCGTPVISTDYGGFVESVEHGKTGYRCQSLGEFVQAIHLAKELSRDYIRARAETLYTEGPAAVSYQQYFDRLATLKGDGWRTLTPTLKGTHGSQQLYPGTDHSTPRPADQSATDERPESVCAAATA